MKKFIYTLAVLAVAGSSVHAQEFDDIYYNPKKESNKTAEPKNKKSNYIADFSSVDVDEYNRRGQYYESPIDTIGVAAESGEDFVYTQKIQKYYNPTIVVDNVAVLMDVLDNSYGNVEVVFDNGYPSFNSIYGWPGYYSSYAWYPSWRWNTGFSWAWSPVWGWEWYPSWSIGPSWSWGPGLNYWGYNSWGWGSYWYPYYNPGWGWGGWGRPYYADYRPNGRGPNYAGAGWAANTRPGGNVGYAASSRPGYSGVNKGNNVNTAVNYHRGSTGSYGSVANRVNSGNTTGTSRNGYSVGGDGHRRYGTTTNSGSSNRYNGTTNSSSHRTQSSTNSSTYRNTNTGSSRSSSYNSGNSGSSHRSSGGGSYGGSRSSGGSGRGRR